METAADCQSSKNLIDTAEEDDSTVRRNILRDLEQEKDNINEAFERNELDYGRKLYLIENCIYGVDIQPVAVQIAKLRFFISLVVDQKIDDAQENRGVRPLPNLETKFVAGNTLIDVEKPAQLLMRNPEIDRKGSGIGRGSAGNTSPLARQGRKRNIGTLISTSVPTSANCSRATVSPAKQLKKLPIGILMTRMQLPISLMPSGCSVSRRGLMS